MRPEAHNGSQNDACCHCSLALRRYSHYGSQDEADCLLTLIVVLGIDALVVDGAVWFQALLSSGRVVVHHAKVNSTRS